MKRIAIIVSVIVVALAAVLVTSCKKDPKNMTPEEVVQAAFDAYVAKDFKTFFSYTDLTAEDQAAWTETFDKKVDEGTLTTYSDFSVKGSTISGDTASVNLWAKDSEGKITETSYSLVKLPSGWKIKWLSK